MSASIYSNIASNRRGTWLVMAIFIAVLAGLGWFFGEYFMGGSGLSFLGFALIFSGISSLISYYYSDKMVLAISGAHEIKESDNEQLHNLVENLCIGAGLPKPKIYMIDDSAPNAFATGRDPNHAVICFTTGIVNKLNKLELEGVIAHELSHIQNYDIRLMSIVSILVGTITLLADWFTHGLFYGSSRRNRSEGSLGPMILILGVVLVVLSPVIATLIKLAVSRKREFLADASAAYLTRYPKGLAAALRKISADNEVLEVANGATAHLYITNPLKGQSGKFLAKLFNTHPPIEDRITRLEQM